MHADTIASELNSATTSAAASVESRPAAANSEEDRGGTESAYLETEIACSHVAIRKALDRLRQHVADAADPYELVQKHPWMSLGAAVSAGFVSAAAVVPGKGETPTEKWSRLKAHLPESAKLDETGEDESAAPIKTAIVTFLMTNVADIVRIAIEKYLNGDHGTGSDAAQAGHDDDFKQDAASFGPEDFHS